MKVAVITGSGGLIGSQSVEFFASDFDIVVGIDNDMRKIFFGSIASTEWNVDSLKGKFKNYIHKSIDIRSNEDVDKIFREYNKDIKLIIHSAAQPSHDWAASDPITDFTINANGTLVILESFRKYCAEAVFIYCSTNKVYGDQPNNLPIIELDKRWEIDESHRYYAYGIDELMSVDNTKHSLFGVSKLSGDLLTQEYGKYFNLKTGVFRGGCLTGPRHSGAELHGFLSYLIKCVLTGQEYNIYGYKGKQVRDNIHSYDFVNMVSEFYKSPKISGVYNVGGSRFSNCSILEAIEISENISGKKLKYKYHKQNRIGDHIWYVSDVRKFQKDFPAWNYKYDINKIINEIIIDLDSRLLK